MNNFDGTSSTLLDVKIGDPAPDSQWFSPIIGSTGCALDRHDYRQGKDSPNGRPFSELLFCRNCGNVIKFALESDHD